jgi:hypothetical protein
MKLLNIVRKMTALRIKRNLNKNFQRQKLNRTLGNEKLN